MLPPVCILGRFPPPIDGQTVATERLASLLDSDASVRRIDVTARETEQVRTQARFRLARVRHYWTNRSRIRHALAAAPQATVLWASISPMPLGHLRDRLVLIPALQPSQRVFGIVHWGNFDRVFRHPLTATSARNAVSQLHGLVFLNDQFAECCGAWVPPNKRFVIPNTIDDAVLCSTTEIAAKQARRTTETAEACPLRLLFLSNMIPEKGYLDVLEAIRILHGRGIRIRADFAGGWMRESDRTAFERLVATYDLGGAVTHHGTIRDRARIKTLYLQADLFLLPTYYPTEAQPLSILEALNAGTPVIATRHAGIPAMVREGTEAQFVPPRDPRAIADAVERLADLGAWRTFSTAARQRFADTFSPDAVRQQWLALIDG